MISLRRAEERRFERRRGQELWNTFHPRERSDPLADGFGTLESLSENRLSPGAAAARHHSHEAEIVSYVRQGALAQEDSTGSSDVIQPGEFQRMCTGRGVHCKETNASRSQRAQIFRISLRPSQVGLECGREQKRFSVAIRSNVLCAVASPDGRNGSLRILQDAVVYSSVLAPGHHLVHELLPGRSAWLHVISGEGILHDIILAPGDGVGVTNEPAVSLTARGDTEILLVDVKGSLAKSGE